MQVPSQITGKPLRKLVIKTRLMQTIHPPREHLAIDAVWMGRTRASGHA